MKSVDQIRLQSNAYRYGFNGMEKDDNIKGQGNSLDFGARIYDPRLGRWLSLDPSMVKYPGWSPYNFTMNNPVLFIDPDGKDSRISITKDANGGGVITVTTVAHVYGNTAEAVAAYGNAQVSSLKESGELSKTYIDGDGNSWQVNFEVRFEVTQELQDLDPNNEGIDYDGAKNVEGVEPGDNIVCTSCPSTAAEDATQYGSDAVAPTANAALHGVLHNIGLDHSSDKTDVMHNTLLTGGEGTGSTMDQKHFDKVGDFAVYLMKTGELKGLDDGEGTTNIVLKNRPLKPVKMNSSRTEPIPD